MEGSAGQIQCVGLGCEGSTQLFPKMSSAACHNSVWDMETMIYQWTALYSLQCVFLDILTLSGKQDSDSQLP